MTYLDRNERLANSALLTVTDIGSATAITITLKYELQKYAPQLEDYIRKITLDMIARIREEEG